MLDRFENMKKEQEAETAKRVAEERSKRAASEKQQQGSVTKKDDPPKQTKAPLEPKETPEARPKTPPPAEDVAPAEVKTTEGKNEEQATTSEHAESDKIVGGINVSSILRERKASSASSTKDQNDDEWADDQKDSNPAADVQKDPLATEATADKTVDEGLKCIARYSYEKSEKKNSYSAID